MQAIITYPYYVTLAFHSIIVYFLAITGIGFGDDVVSKTLWRDIREQCAGCSLKLFPGRRPNKFLVYRLARNYKYRQKNQSRRPFWHGISVAAPYGQALLPLIAADIRQAHRPGIAVQVERHARIDAFVDGRGAAL